MKQLSLSDTHSECKQHPTSTKIPSPFDDPGHIPGFARGASRGQTTNAPPDIPASIKNTALVPSIALNNLLRGYLIFSSKSKFNLSLLMVPRYSPA